MNKRLGFEYQYWQVEQKYELLLFAISLLVGSGAIWGGGGEEMGFSKGVRAAGGGGLRGLRMRGRGGGRVRGRGRGWRRG